MSRWLSSLLILVACSSDPSTQTTSSEGVTIAAANVHQIGSVDGEGPSTGHKLVAIDITLGDAGTKAAPLDPAQFSLETTAGIAFIASPLTAGYTNPCDASALVEPGATGSCSAVFEVDSTSLSKLIYTLLDGTTASTAVSLASGSGGSGSAASDGWGDVCDAGHPCAAPLTCLADGSGFASTCELPCTGDTDSVCMDDYTGSGMAACVGTGDGGGSAVCLILCTSSDQCPGDLECDDLTTPGSGVAAGSNGLCFPPAE